MLPTNPTEWWTAFGALAQAGGVATFAAVAVSLWVVLSERAMRAQGSAGIKVIFAGDGTPGVYMVGIDILTVGVRPFHVSSVGWRTGWLPRGPKALHFRHAIQNPWMMLNPGPGPHIVEPGRNQGFYTKVGDMKSADAEASRTEMFARRVPILGEASIRAMVHITGRKPLVVKVTKDLADFLRTGEHASTMGEGE